MRQILPAITLPSLVLCLAACGGAPSTTRTVVQMDALRVTPNEVYDAESLFNDALALGKAGKCLEGVPKYDKVDAQFPESLFASAAVYNAGLCLVDAGQLDGAIARFDRVITAYPTSDDVLMARYQLALTYLQKQDFAPAVTVTTALAETKNLDAKQKLEAWSLRARALLGAGDLDGAQSQAITAIAFQKEQPKDNDPSDEGFAAAANYVLAEVYRLRSEAIEIPVGTAELQHQVLEQRAQLLLRAQHEYFDTIAFMNPEWGAAAGFRIGALYNGMWGAITAAPVPPPKTHFVGAALAAYEDEYRKQMQRMIRPLVRHAIRYWELTLMMIERTQVKSPWAEQVRAELEKARTLLIAQPEDDAEEAAAVETKDTSPKNETTKPAGTAPKSGQSLAKPPTP